MSNAKIAAAVEGWITSTRFGDKAREIFRKHLEQFAVYRKVRQEAELHQPKGHDDSADCYGPTGCYCPPGYQYDGDFRRWEPINPPVLPPNPVTWEITDKLVCYYATVAVIYDHEKRKRAVYRLCDGVIDPDTCAVLLAYCEGYFGPDDLSSAWKWVKWDLKEKCSDPQHERTPENPEPQAEKAEQTPPAPESREKPWDDKKPGFILISEARKKYCDGPMVPTLAVLGRDHCKPDGEFDYMRKGQRRKVHEEQFAACAERYGWTKAAVAKARAFIVASETPRTRQAKLRKRYDMHSEDWDQ